MSFQSHMAKPLANYNIVPGAHRMVFIYVLAHVDQGKR